MIERIKPSHNIKEYFECIKDLTDIRLLCKDSDAYQKIVWMNPNYEVYVCIVDEKIVATASIIYEYKLRYSKPKAYIEDVAVHEDYRGRGLGKQMIEHCVGVAKNRDCYKIVLSCKDNLVSFYENLGFEKDQNFMVKK